MAYSVVGDVKAKLQCADFTTSTIPTLAQVTQWIVEADAEINAILRHHGFTPPVTDADGFLKKLSAAGASYETAQAIYTGEGFNQSDRIERLYREWQDGLERLRKSPNMIQSTASVTVADVVTVPDATFATSAPARFTMDTEY